MLMLLGIMIALSGGVFLAQTIIYFLDKDRFGSILNGLISIISLFISITMFNVHHKSVEKALWILEKEFIAKEYSNMQFDKFYKFHIYKKDLAWYFLDSQRKIKVEEFEGKN